MTMKVHHATLKKARKLGLAIEVIENEAVVKYGDVVIASHPDASVALKLAIERGQEEPEEESEGAEGAEGADEADEATDEATDGQDEATDDEDAPRSVIKPHYKKKYKPHNNTCGDQLSRDLADYWKTTNDDGEERIDAMKLRRFADMNGLWQDKYQHLNVGMQRMN